MALRLSTGLRQDLLGTNDFKTVFTLSFINIYSGTQPLTADDSIGTSTLIATIYSDLTTTGVSFDAPVAGVISKAVAETWSGAALTSATAGWFRLYEAGDTPAAASTVTSRLDGTIAVSGADLNISNTTISSGAVQTLTQFDITLPAS